MTAKEYPRDLVVLVADADMAEAVRGLLRRPESLGIGKLAWRVVTHAMHDAGCRTAASAELRRFQSEFKQAVVMFDHSGCGDQRPREVIQREVEAGLARNGWRNRAKAIVIEPELEAWVWSRSRHVPELLGWTAGYPALRSWLERNGLWRTGESKPIDPKGAMRRALRQMNLQPSARRFAELAGAVSLQRCSDPAFNEFTRTLRKWFPTEGS